MRRKGSDTRAEIQDVAMTLFTERGYEATSMREIAEQLDITKAALYYHFDSKEAIVLGLLDEYLRALDELLDWAAGRPHSPELASELLGGWLALGTGRGMRTMRFAVSNHHALRAARPPGPGGMLQRIDRASLLILGPRASLQDQLRVRMALVCVQSATVASYGTEADDATIHAAVTDAAARLIGDLIPAPKLPPEGQWRPPS